MKYHLLGIGGVGMSALATALKRFGHEVSGADRNLATPNIAALESRGIRCYPDDGSGIDRATDEIVVSTAIESDNPGLVRAQEFGIPVVHRAKALAKALENHRLVAVVGTCGKSTVTAMLGHILAECGMDPLCVNGANVPGWDGAVRYGHGSFAVAEVDESDRSLVAFSPYAAIITNASADHYSKEEMDQVFDDFVKNLPGPLVDGRLIAGEAEVSTIGSHNRSNAFLALRMAVALGCEEARAREALLTFGGVERRLQRYGDRVYDDYAHNPEKLRAMWIAIAGEHREGGLCVVWRPHGYAPLRKMMDEFVRMFEETVRPDDLLLVLPVYDAGGTADRSVNSGELVSRLEGRVPVRLVADHDAALTLVDSHRGDFAAFATCGARDPELPALARRISEAVGAKRA